MSKLTSRTKNSNFTANQESYFVGFVQYVKDSKSSVDNKSSEPANFEKRQRTITKRLSDVVNELIKKKNPTKKKKRIATLSDAVEEVVSVSDDEAEGARIESSSEVSEKETDGATKASKKSKDNRSKAKPIRILESSPNPSTGLTNILQDDPQREKINDDNEVMEITQEEKSDGARCKFSKANTRYVSNNGGVPESTPKNIEIGSEVSNGATSRSKAIIKTNDNNRSKAQSIRREDDNGEDDYNEAMEITQEEKSYGEKTMKVTI